MGWIDAGALAATSSASTAVASTCPMQPQPRCVRAPQPIPHPVRAGEKTLTCADWATAKAGALKAVPGGTAYRVETDADGATYEAYMTKADGTHVSREVRQELRSHSAPERKRHGRTGRRNGPPQTRGNPSGLQRSRPLIGHRPG
jgi:hypothetical protein